MAQVPTTQGPSVAPSAAPSPFLSVQPNPAAFGASVAGAGLSDVGKGAGDLSEALQQHAMAFQAINNKQAADAAGMDFVNAQSGIQSAYRANNAGMSAMDNLHEALGDIESARKAGSVGLTPMAQVQYEEYSRRAATYAVNDLTTYANTQRREAIAKTADATIANAGQLFVTHADDPQAEAGFVSTVGSQVAQIMAPQHLDVDSPLLKQAMLNYTSPVYSQVIKQAYDSGDLDKANGLLDKYRTALTPEAYTNLAGGLRTANQANVIQSAAQAAVRGGDWIPPGAGNPSYTQGIHGREGTAKNPASTADGVGQFTEGTWRSVMSEPQFANDVKGLSDAQVLALRHDPAIADRAIMAYGQQNASALQSAGLAPTNANVALAHGYGPVGVEAILRADPNTPVASIIGAQTAANNRVSGQTVAQVISSFTSRFGTADFGQSTASATPVHFDPPMALTPSTDPAAYAATVDARLLAEAPQLFPNNAEQQQRFIASGRQLANVQVAQLDSAQKSTYDTLDKWVTDNNVEDPTALQAKYPTEWSTLPAKYQSALERSMQFNSRVLTPERAASIDTLNGMWALRASDPSKFLSADIRAMDIPLSTKTQFIKEQDQLRANVNSQTQTDKVVQHVMDSVDGRSALAALKIKRTDPAYFQFAGALQSSVDAFRAQHNGAGPSDKDIHSMVSQVTAKTSGGLFGIGAQPGFKVPSGDEAQIRDAYAKLNLGEPTAEDIGRAYADRQRTVR